MKQTKKKRIVWALALAATSLTIAESSLRAFWGFGNPPLVYRDSDFGYAFKPNQDLRRFGNRVYYNEVGLRSEPLKHRRGSSIRVLCVGDSITNGGVLTDQSETYPYVLESLLAKMGIASQVLNASAGAWAPQNELGYLRKKGIFQADVVVLQIGTHDLSQIKSSAEVVGTDPDFPDKKPLSATGELLYRYLLPRLKNLVRPEADAATDPTATNSNACLRAIEQMIALVKNESSRPVIVLIPNRSELDHADAAADNLKHVLTKFAATEAVPVVNVLVGMKQSMTAGFNPYRDRVHPNPTGNRVIARELAPVIAELVSVN